MKKIILTLLLALFIIPVVAQEHIKFKGVPIDGKVSDFVAKMKSKGLVSEPSLSTDRVYAMSGSFAGYNDCLIAILYTEDKIVCKVSVLFDNKTSWVSLKDQYNTINETLREKYTVDNSYNFFTDPYYDGDGYEFQALKLEKAVVATFYKAPGGAIKIECEAQDSSSGYISLVYQDDQNFKAISESKKRQQAEDL